MKISVVIPAYNSEKTILRALASVKAQTAGVHEIIVVDDGSSDSTINLVQSHHPDIVIRQFDQNQGPGAARNAGIKAAAGDWIAFLDADDQWLPGKLQCQCQLLECRPELVWCCTNYTIRKNAQRAPKIDPAKARSALKEGAFFENYFTAAADNLCDIQTSTLMVKKAVFDELGAFNSALMRHQDWDLWWRIAHHYPIIGFVPEPQIVHHLLYDNQVVNQRRLEAKKGRWLSELIQTHLQTAHQQGTRSAFVPFARMYVRNCLLSMLFIGLTTEAKMMTSRFPDLLTLSERLFFKSMVYTAPVSLALFRASVWIFEKCGISKMSHRNWDYWKAYRQTKSQG